MLSLPLLLGTAVGAYLGVSGYVAAHMTRVARVPLETTPGNLGLPYEDVAFPSRDSSILLRGWLISRGEPELWLILVHGNGGNRADPSVNLLGLTRDLVKRGFGILTFDLRAHGESQGSRTSIGYSEPKDLQGAMHFLQGRGVAKDRIGVIGYSLGAVITLMMAAEESNLAGIVLDSPFANLGEMVRQEGSKRSGLPGLFIPGMMLMSRILFGVNLSSVRPLEMVKRIRCPLLFVHGKDDDLVDHSHATRLFEAAREGNKELWLVPNAGHGKSYSTHPEEYVSRVEGFFRKVASEGA